MSCRQCRNLDRRSFLGLLGTGLALTLAGCGSAGRVAVPSTTGLPPSGGPSSSGSPTSRPSTPLPAPTTTAPRPVVRGPIPPPHPGPANVISAGPPEAKTANQIAITIDDGYCTECATAYVDFAKSSGIHITFSPNGTYSGVWSPLAETLKPLIQAGQVQIGNHTYTHLDMQKLSDSAIGADLERNDEWIQKTFGITSRPWWRPPYGYHNTRTDAAAGQAGYTNTLMWNGTFGDSTLLSAGELLASAHQYLTPGTIMLGHANHPTVNTLFPQIQQIIADARLKPVTLDEMFGTSRDAG